MDFGEEDFMRRDGGAWRSWRLALMLVLPAAAGCMSMGGAVSLAGLLTGTCPPPRALSDADQKKLAGFAGEVSGIIEQAAGSAASARIKAKALSYYPVGQEVARVYALGHAACVACRTKAQNVPTCAEAFSHLIAALTPRSRGEEVSPALLAADDYSGTILRGMLPPAD